MKFLGRCNLTQIFIPLYKYQKPPLKKVGFEGGRCHKARRTLTTLLYEHGLPLVQIMKITGHKKLATLQKYIKSDSDIQMMLDVGNSIGKNV